MKYIFVTGGVMSGIGKGITSSSIGKILKLHGFKVCPIKIDPYINFDAGTMNPFVHGEVFVLDDGYEADMDIGTYERFLNMDLSREHNLTTGQIYDSVLRKERSGKYLGQCVQIIPHITDEIKHRIRSTSEKFGGDITIIECGGTVGDIESLPFLEAIRQIRLEENVIDTASVHVTLVPKLDIVGEQKTKPTQHSVQELRKIGIHPDIILARSTTELVKSTRDKISLFSNVPSTHVISLPDVKNIYSVPENLKNHGFHSVIAERLGLVISENHDGWKQWNAIVKPFEHEEQKIRIAIGGKYVSLSDSYVSVKEAIRHAAAQVGVKPEITFIDTEKVEQDFNELKKLDDIDGIIIPGGFGYRGAEGKIKISEYAMNRSIPFLGLCFGFQLSIVMFSRSVLGLKDANSTELDKDTQYPVIDLLSEQVDVDDKGGTMRLGGYEIKLDTKSKINRLYGKDIIRVRHRHRYIPNKSYEEKLVNKGLCISGKSLNEDHTEVIELEDHPFFMSTQFHPEFTSRPERPDPIYLGFIEAAFKRKTKREK